MGVLSHSLFIRLIPPTEKVNEIIKTSFALLFKRNGIIIYLSVSRASLATCSRKAAHPASP